MSTRISGKLTYANVMATIAVFFAIGGAGYAAFKVPANSVGSKQLKTHSVTPGKVAPRTASLFKGQTGPPGKSGAPGSARAYAYVHAGCNSCMVHARLDSSSSKGFASVSSGGSGVYCLTPTTGIDPARSAPVVTPVWNSGIVDRANAQLTDVQSCGARQLAVYTYTDQSSTYPKATNGIDFTVVLP